MQYSIIKFNYKLQKPYKPGKCIKINNEYYSIFNYQENSFKILVKNNSKLINLTTFNIIELDTTGFNMNYTQDEKILVIAGGTGISAIVDFIKTYIYKTNIFLIYYTNIDFNLNDYFLENEIKKFHYIIWNTHILGRPKNPVIGYNIENIQIFASGPKSLINDLKNISKNLQLNY